MTSLRRILPAFTIFFAAGSILFLLLVIGMLYEKAEAAMPREESDPLMEDAAVQIPDPRPPYTIRLTDGELQLYSPELPDSYTVLHSIDPRTLRSADRDSLTAGVALPSMEAVVRFLEDFGS